MKYKNCTPGMVITFPGEKDKWTVLSRSTLYSKREGMTYWCHREGSKEDFLKGSRQCPPDLECEVAEYVLDFQI